MLAPMLCGCVTVFDPLKEYGAGNPTKDVGIIGTSASVRTLHFYLFDIMFDLQSNLGVLFMSEH